MRHVQSLEARAFVLAFCPNETEQDTARVWGELVTNAISALIDFRSATHKWQALGAINPIEYTDQLERLDAVGLAGLVDNLIAEAMRIEQ